MPPRPRRVAPRARERASAIVARLAQAYPGATTELVYRTPFELLVATVLSAQSTDARVNAVTPALFARYPDARALAAATPGELEPLVRATGFFRAKSRAVVGLARALVERFGGDVPPRLEDLVTLPGVGRKTANVVLGHAFGVPGLPVDRHVFRVAQRIGLARGRTPVALEARLAAQLPPETWTLASDCLILHGRRVCRPKPLCQKCGVRADCAFYLSGDQARTARPAPAGRASAAPERPRPSRPERGRRRSRP